MVFLDFLKLPEVKNITNLDDPATTQLHAKIIESKPFLRRLYCDFYQEFEKVVKENPDGKYVEIGSGGGFLKKIIPQVLSLDILQLPRVDICCSAEKLPFKDKQVDAFFMLNTLHHFKNPSYVLTEIQRCLKEGGRVVMIEPANTFFGRWIYQNFHHEPFEPKAGWNIEGSGPLSDANGALPWIIFERDRVKFEREFPSLSIERFVSHTPMRYLLSGGVSLKQLVPSFMYSTVKFLEWILTPLSGFLGMFYTIDLKLSKGQ